MRKFTIYALILAWSWFSFAVNSQAAATLEQKDYFIYIRGVGKSEKPAGYSKQFAKKLSPSPLDHIEYDWQKIVEVPTDEFFNKTWKKPAWYHPKRLTTYAIRKAVFDYATEATAYNNFKKKILLNLHKIVPLNRKVVIIAHSLGCVISHDYIEAYKPPNVKMFISLGCSLPLFKMGLKPVNLGVKHVNYYEPNDILAMPVYGAKNIEFNSSNVIKGFNIGAHATYWKSAKLLKMIEGEL